MGGGGGGGGSDASFSSVRLLLGGEGTDASTTITDESSSPRTMTALNGAQIDTAQFKFGAASILFDGSDDFARVVGSAANTNFSTLSAAGWTIEMWVRFSSTGGDQGFCGQFDSGSGYFCRFNGGLSWFCNSGGTAASASWSPSTGVWYHVAYAYDGTKIRIYVDGVFLGGQIGTNHGALGNTGAEFGVGAQNGASGGRHFAGWQDEFRFTNGACRYTTESSFTVPAAAYPRS
jgi:hypothetical protein